MEEQPVVIQKNYKRVVVRNGISVMGLLGVCLVVLKVLNFIDLSWWLVLLPFYGPAAFGIGVVLFIFLLAVIGTIFDARR